MRMYALSRRAWAVVLFGILPVFACSHAMVFAQTDTGPSDVSEGATASLGADSATAESVALPADTTAPTASATGAEYGVTPVVANEKAKPRDIIKKELLVTNHTQQRLDVYANVNNIDPGKGTQVFDGPTDSDLSTSLANWIEITRGVIELGPGETRKIPYLIHVNLTAKPGSYFARIAFVKTPQSQTPEVAPEEGTALLLNVEVLDDAKERLQLGSFRADDSVVTGNEASFSYQLENVGNRQLEPRGSIRIFNTRGEEVGSVPLNADGDQISPDNKAQLAAVWNAAGRFGKYKAFLDLEYGENQAASVQDTVYFWVFPWKEVMTAVMGVLILGVLGTYIVHMRAMAVPARARARNNTVPDVRERAPLGHTDEPVAREPYPYAPQANAGEVTVLSARPRRMSGALPNTQNPYPQAPAPARGAPDTTYVRPRTSAPSVSGNTIQLGSRR